MATVVTFGVDQTHVQSFEPQISIGSDGPVTTARLTVMINASSARINGLMSWHGIDPAGITDTSSVEYLNAQRLITDRVLLDLRAAAYGGVSVAAEIAIYDERADTELSEWRRAPDTMGADVTSDVDPGIHTSTQALGLNTSETCRRGRRRYDRATCRTSETDDRHRW